MGALTWGEMRQLLLDKHVVIEESLAVNVNGQIENYTYLRRMDGKKLLCHPFPILTLPDEFMTAQAIRNICAKLKVPVHDFGLTIG